MCHALKATLFLVLMTAAARPAAAQIDLSGEWAGTFYEDLPHRGGMQLGDYTGLPLNEAGWRKAESWDPAKISDDGCKAYGAVAIMRVPGRLRISWQDDNTLKIETDYGTQTRLLHFGGAPTAPGAKTWQGVTTAQWIMAAGGGRGRGGPRHGSIKSVTTQMRPGYLRKNGVPYGDRAVFTEYWDLQTETNGDQYLVDTNLVDDPVYLQTPWITTLHFKKEPDGSKWDPSTCDARF
jgi:hypothetical protein